MTQAADALFSYAAAAYSGAAVMDAVVGCSLQGAACKLDGSICFPCKNEMQQLQAFNSLQFCDHSTVGSCKNCVVEGAMPTVMSQATNTKHLPDSACASMLAEYLHWLSVYSVCCPERKCIVNLCLVQKGHGTCSRTELPGIPDASFLAQAEDVRLLVQL